MKVISMSEVENQTAAAAKPVLTKEEKIAKIDKQIAALQAKRDDVVNDRVTSKAGKKVTYAPAVGDKVMATVGRNTATGKQAQVVPGVVTAVKTPAEGEKGATQVRVRIYEGTFEEQLVTLYPAQLEQVKDEAPTDEISDRPLGELPQA